MIGLRKAPQLLSKATTLAVARNMSAIPGPPMIRVSFAEKVAHGIVITAGIMAYPCWVLVHIREYRGLA